VDDNELNAVARKVVEILEQEPRPVKNDEVQKIAKAVVAEMVTAWGVDIKNPLEMQEDFAWIRKYRKMAERIGSAVMILVALTIAGGILSMIAKSLWPANNTP
jgi:hypothetical protein